jgi:nicotinamide mononucleotide transporter
LNTAIEIVAAVLGLAYVLLAIRERRACWIAGGLASLLFLFVFWHAGLAMQAFLQIYYAGIAVHAWRTWGRDDRDPLPISRFSGRYHALLLALLLSATVITVLLRRNGGGIEAWLDAATSWGGVLATWLVARKALAAWLYWIIIDLATVALYMQAGLLASSALYALYTALAFLGWREWRKHYRIQSATPAGVPS